MSRPTLLIVLGILVLLAPFSGLPMSILTWILPLLGLSILAIGILVRKEETKTTLSHEAPLSAH